MLRCGLTPRQVEGMLVARREAVRAYEGVLPARPDDVADHGDAMAAVLACGPRGLAQSPLRRALRCSRRSPASGIAVRRHDHGTASRPASGHPLHRVKSLRGPGSATCTTAFPVTSPERTLIDLGRRPAAGLSSRPPSPRRSRCGLTNREQLLEAIGRARGRRGVARLREPCSRRPDRPPGRVQRPSAGCSADPRRWPSGAGDERPGRALGGRLPLARAEASYVEVDAYATHSSPWAFERDRRKTAELEDLGLAVHRVTAVGIATTPVAAIARIRRTLTRE